MKKYVFLVLFSTLLLSGCNLSNHTQKETSSTIETRESVIPKTSENKINDSSMQTTSERSSNYTIEAVREMAEKTENIDSIISDLYITPDDYYILAEPSSQEGIYDFIIGPASDEPAIHSENRKDSEKYTLSKNSQATSIKEVKQLIEDLQH